MFLESFSWRKGNTFIFIVPASIRNACFICRFIIIKVFFYVKISFFTISFCLIIFLVKFIFKFILSFFKSWVYFKFLLNSLIDFQSRNLQKLHQLNLLRRKLLCQLLLK